MTPLRSRASAVIFRTATARAATLSIGTISVCALALTSCGSDDAPEKVTDVRWQVTAVGDAAYDAPAQARTWIVLGSNTVTGGSGCERFNGKVDWSGSDDSGRITLSDVSTTTEGDCAPADSYNAEQISSILNTPDLRWTFDDGKGGDGSSGSQEDSAMRHLRLWVDGSPEQGISFAG